MVSFPIFLAIYAVNFTLPFSLMRPVSLPHLSRSPFALSVFPSALVISAHLHGPIAVESPELLARPAEIPIGPLYKPAVAP